MKKFTPFPYAAALLLGAALFNQPAQGQLSLTGTNYSETFDAISNGLPVGWSVRIDAATNTSGTITTNYNAAEGTWAGTHGEFRNCASTLSDAGTNFIGNEGTSVQTNCLNRALAVRQTGSFGDPGAAFVLQIANTLGVSNLTFSVDLCTLRTNGNITTWTIQYAVGDSPDWFTTLGTYTNSADFGATTETYNLGADADNQSAKVWLRIAALAPAVGSGNRGTFGIDNFSFAWEGNSAFIVAPSISGITLTNGNAQIDFTGDATDSRSAFALQCASRISDDFVDTDATITQMSPGNFRAVCAMNSSQQFYRIRRP